MKMRIVFAAAVMALAVLASAFPAHAGQPSSCKPGEVFANEEVSIWFHGKKGFVKVFDTNESSQEQHVYDYKTGRLTELGADNMTLASMNLERAYPQTSGCEIVETNEFVNMSITITDDVKPGQGHGSSVGEATVTFAYHFNKSSQGAKFDLFVENWPWQSADSELAYAFSVHAPNGNIEAAENGVGFSNESGAPRGYIEWAPNATAFYDDGHNETALVDGETEVSGNTAEVVLRFTNVTAGYSYLEYDPFVGVGPYVIIAGVLVGLAPAAPALKLARELLGLAR